MESFYKKQKNQDGQALLFVIVSLTVALAVGVSTSLRTLSSISRVSTTDTAARAQAAAEGGLEEFLAHSTTQLEADASTCTPAAVAEDPPEECVVDFGTDTDADIQTQAVVSVEEYVGEESTIDSSTYWVYSTAVKASRPISVNLSTYDESDLTLCWDTDTPLFYLRYNGDANSNWESGFICPTASDGCGTGETNLEGDVVGAQDTSICEDLGFADGDFGQGYTFTGLGAPLDKIAGIFIYPVNPADTSNVDTNLALVSASAFDSPLGYLITSRGELMQQSEVVATTIETAQRGYPHVTAPFLFSMFALEGIVDSE